MAWLALPASPATTSTACSAIMTPTYAPTVCQATGYRAQLACPARSPTAGTAAPTISRAQVALVAMSPRPGLVSTASMASAMLVNIFFHSAAQAASRAMVYSMVHVSPALCPTAISAIQGLVRALSARQGLESVIMGHVRPVSPHALPALDQTATTARPVLTANMLIRVGAVIHA